MSVVFRTILFVVFVHGFFLLGIPWILVFSRLLLFSSGLMMTKWPALSLLLMGSSFYVSCVWNFIVLGKGTPAAWDAPQEFVSKGLYRQVRNPMYVGMFMILAAQAVFFKSAGIFLYLMILWFSFHLFVVYYEEPALKRRFGDVYRDYLRSVPRWIPRISPRSARIMGG